MYRSISLYDLMCIEPIAKIIKAEDKEKLNVVLWYLGLDVHHNEYEEVVVKHRPILKKDREIIEGLVFRSRERTDEEWLKDPSCSLDTRLYVADDKEMNKDITQMGRTLSWEDQMGEH